MVLKEKLQKILPLSSDKVGQFDYLKDEEILPLDQSAMTEKAKFTYFP